MVNVGILFYSCFLRKILRDVLLCTLAIKYMLTKKWTTSNDKNTYIWCSTIWRRNMIFQLVNNLHKRKSSALCDWDVPGILMNQWQCFLRVDDLRYGVALYFSCITGTDKQYSTIRTLAMNTSSFRKIVCLEIFN